MSERREVAEPIGDHVARICFAARALDNDRALAAGRAVPVVDRPAVLAALGQVHMLFEKGPTWVPFAIATAGLLTAPSGVAALLGPVWFGRTGMGIDQARAVVTGHSPAWRARFARSVLHGRLHAWRVVHDLVGRGLIERPDDPEFARAFLAGTHPWEHLPCARAADPSLDQLLQELWSTAGVGTTLGRLWPVAEIPHHQFHVAPDRSYHPDRSWEGLLHAWGVDDPERRADAINNCLAALSGASGSAAADLHGWGIVHGRLELTPDEVADHQVTYLNLVAGGGAPAATLARAQLAGLLDAGRLDPDALLEITPDALLRAEKNAVREHLALLTTAVKRGALDPAACAEAVRPTVEHLPPGVGPAAQKLLALCGSPAAPARAVKAWAPSIPVDLPSPGAVEPVLSTDDLVDLLVTVMRDPSDPIDVERAVDGMLRLRGVRPTVARQLRWLGGTDCLGALSGLTRLLSAWLGQVWATPRLGTVTRTSYAHSLEQAQANIPPGVQARSWESSQFRTVHADGTITYELTSTTWSWDEPAIAWTPSHLIAARMLALEPLVVGTPLPALALPTTQHGTVSADALLGRLRQWAEAGVTPVAREFATAIQRLEPGDRAALAASGVLAADGSRWLAQTEVQRTWQHLLVGPERWGRGGWSVGSLKLWQPDDRAEPLPDGDADEPVRWWFDTRTVIDCWTEHETSGLYQTPGVNDVLSSFVLQLPSHPDVIAVHLQPEVMTWIEHPDADLSSLLRVLAERRVPLGRPTADLFAWAASYRNPRTRSAAAEAIVTAARHGVLDGRLLGAGITRLVGPDAGPFLTFGNDAQRPKLSRIASTLADAARIDEHGERVVLDAVVACLPILREARGGVALLEIAAAIAERRGVRVDLPEPLASLAAGRASSRTAQEARRLAGRGRTSVLWGPSRELAHVPE